MLDRVLWNAMSWAVTATNSRADGPALEQGNDPADDQSFSITLNRQGPPSGQGTP
jgi:hypothetical protein